MKTRAQIRRFALYALAAIAVHIALRALFFAVLICVALSEGSR